MKPCKNRDLNSSGWGKKFWLHRWGAWGRPVERVYRGKQTLVQLRSCVRCDKVQVREC